MHPKDAIRKLREAGYEVEELETDTWMIRNPEIDDPEAQVVGRVAGPDMLSMFVELLQFERQRAGS